MKFTTQSTSKLGIDAIKNEFLSDADLVFSSYCH